MALDIDGFCRLRPYLYHLTAEENLGRIRQSMALESAALLAEKAGEVHLLRMRREGHVVLQVDGGRTLIRDQMPLHASNMRLDPGWDFDRLLRSINERVFFWAGTERGPIDYGVRHFERYSEERPVILRVLSNSLIRANSSSPPFFCRFNSGSPRWSGGKPSPRGAGTFVLAQEATFPAGEVVEVTFEGEVKLPAGTQVGSAPTGPWDLLRQDASARRA